MPECHGTQTFLLEEPPSKTNLCKDNGVEKHSEPAKQTITISQRNLLHLMNGTGYWQSLNPSLAWTSLPLLINAWAIEHPIHCGTSRYRLADVNNTNINIYTLCPPCWAQCYSHLSTIVFNLPLCVNTKRENSMVYGFTQCICTSYHESWILSLLSLSMNSCN